MKKARPARRYRRPLQVLPGSRRRQKEAHRQACQGRRQGRPEDIDHALSQRCVQKVAQLGRQKGLDIRLEEVFVILADLPGDGLRQPGAVNRIGQDIQARRKHGGHQAAADPDTNGAAQGSCELVGRRRHPQVLSANAVLDDQEGRNRDKAHPGAGQAEGDGAGRQRRGGGKTDHQRTPEDHEQRTGHGKNLLFSRPDRPATDQRSGRPAQAQKEHGDPQLHRGTAHGALDEKRGKGRKREHRKAAHQHCGVAGAEGRNPEKAHGNQGVRRPPLREIKPQARDGGRAEKADDQGGMPRIIPAGQQKRREQGEDRRGHENDAPVVNGNPHAFFPRLPQKHHDAPQ